MVLFDSKGVIRRYETAEEILRDFFTLRMDYYGKRRLALIQVRPLNSFLPSFRCALSKASCPHSGVPSTASCPHSGVPSQQPLEFLLSQSALVIHLVPCFRMSYPLCAKVGHHSSASKGALCSFARHPK